MLPTAYLWMVDTFALRRGTWSISSGTKYGVEMWRGLDIEEAIFFFLTNTLIVSGLVTFDNALAILDTFPEHFSHLSGLPSPVRLIRALFLSKDRYDQERVAGLINATALLQNKSRSYFLASAAFEGRLRIDLVRLYAFCRAADDLVDEAASVDEAKMWINKLKLYLHIAFGGLVDKRPTSELLEHVKLEFPSWAQLALLQLPTDYIPKQPLEDLLRGFETDVRFSTEYPISSTEDLDLYASQVAGTVAELCNRLILFHTPHSTTTEAHNRLIDAGVEMGIALQYVNIARDIATDAGIGRVYIPNAWLNEKSMKPEEVVQNPSGPAIEEFRQRLLERAFAKYEIARAAINELPSEARGPIRVAVESYMEIGRVLREGNHKIRQGRATVPLWRRIQVAWSALGQ
ncbi:hypothetical protein FDECE_9292 [Fusarium decemcellulare]|nr:hypothetical protein FDECE_9292 [Fusarium decemcellulare]